MGALVVAFEMVVGEDVAGLVGGVVGACVSTITTENRVRPSFLKFKIGYFRARYYGTYDK